MGVLSRILAIVIMGAVFWVLVAVPISTALVASSTVAGASAPASLVPTVIVAAVAILVTVFAPTARIAWGRLFVLAGLAAFALPFQGVILSAIIGSVVTLGLGGNTAATAGVALGGALVTGIAAFFGFFLGLIFVVSAYFTLRGAPRPLRIRG